MGSLGRKLFRATTPHFFKIILEDTSSDYKLKIPQKFLIKYGQDLSNSVHLKLPSGSEWEVELRRCNGKAWFERGWPEFSRFCSLDYGAFLVFRYRGNSQFEVCIFDKSATEIEYPLTMPKIEEVDEDALPIEVLEDSPPCPKRKENSSLLCSPCKKMRTSFSGKTEFATKTDGGCSYRPKRVLQETRHKNLGRIKSLTTTEKAIALQRANAFISDKPSFKMAMQPSHIHFGSKIELPDKFSKRHLIQLPAGIAILRISDGRTWSLKFKYDHKNSKARLSCGWSLFVRDNNLKVGDVCVFVLIDCNELLFEVFFFPTIEATNHPFPPGYGRGAIDQVEERSPIVEAESKIKCEVAENKMPKIYEQVTQKPSSSLRDSRVILEAANKFVSENPFFLVLLRSVHRNNVPVPASFFKSFFNRKKQTVKLQVEDRSWPVNLVPNGIFAGRLSAGWAQFAKEHCLKEGEVCIFELTEMNENKSGDKEKLKSMSSFRRETDRSRPVCCSTTPRFIQVILDDTSRHVKLGIPKKFVNEYCRGLSDSVCLKLPSGSEWEVEVTRSNGKVWFEKCWPEFSKFYSLGIGDFLVFEYEGNSEFNVFIFDRSTTEIEYPIKRPKMEEALDNELSVEISEDIPPSPKTREKTPPPCPQAYKKMKTSLSGKADDVFENVNSEPLEEPKKNNDFHCSASKIKSKKDRGGSSSTERFLKQTPGFCGEKHLSNTNEKASIQRNIASETEKPYFKVVMHPTYIQKGYLPVPSEFSKRHLTNQPATVTLQVLDGRSWSVQLKYYHERAEARFQNCWPLFVRGNNLKVGDVCVFTLINCTEFLFEVVFYRATEAANCPLSPGYGKETIHQVKRKGSPVIEVESDYDVICGIGVSGSLETGKNKVSKTGVQVAGRPSSPLTTPGYNHHEAANNFVSENPFFKVTLGFCHMEKSAVHLPASFAWSFIKREKEKVLLQVTDRLWPVDLIVFKPSLASFSSGWDTFVEEYSLRVGDVCIFELMEMDDDIILQVHFFRC